MLKQLFLMPLAAVFQGGASMDVIAQQEPDQRKVRIEIVTTENGETKRVTREFDAHDDAQIQDALRELGVLDHFRVNGDGDNVTIDIRRFGGDDEESMALSMAPLPPLPPVPPMPALCGKQAYLGVSTESLNDELRSRIKTSLKEGAYVMSVAEDTPAAGIGLKEGDIITAVEGDAIAGPQELAEAIRDHEAGDKVKITYYRDGKKNTVTAELDEHQNSAFAYAYNFDPEHGGEDWDWDSYMGDTPPTHEPRAFLGVTPADGDEHTDGAAIGGVEEDRKSVV